MEANFLKGFPQQILCIKKYPAKYAKEKTGSLLLVNLLLDVTMDKM